MSTIDIRILSAEREIWLGKAYMLTAQTLSGEIGIMHGHIPLFAALQPSAAISVIAEDGSRKIAAVTDGFITVTATGVTVLAQYCEWIEEFDEQEIISIVESTSVGSDEYAFANAKLKALAVLRR